MRLIRWLRGEPATDDRGAIVDALEVRRIRAMAPEGDPSAKALAGELRKVIKQQARGWDFRNVAISFLSAIPILVVFLTLRLRGFPFVVLFVAVNFAQIKVIRWFAERRIARSVARTLGAHGLCGSCGYSLRDIPPEADACAVCPECGGAWATERMTRAHWRAPRAPLFPRRAVRTAAFLILPAVGEDALGVLHRRLDTRLAAISAVVRAMRPESQWRALRRDLRRIGRGWRVVFSAPFFLLGAYCASVLQREADGPQPSRWLLATCAIGLLFLVYVSLSVLVGEWGMSRKRVLETFLRHGACPLCAARPEPRATRWSELLCCDGCGCAWSGGTRAPAAHPLQSASVTA